MPYNAPAPTFIGHDDGVTEVLGPALVASLEAFKERQVHHTSRAIDDYEYEINRLMREMRQLREELQKRQLQKKHAEERLAELQNTDPQDLLQDVDQLCDYIKRLPGVLGTRPTDDGTVLVMLRTAIRNTDGMLYDMGDYTIEIGPKTLKIASPYYEDVAHAFSIKNVRLPRRNPRRYGGWDLRMHHHYGERARNADGIYYIEGGEFCIGNRSQHVYDCIRSGDLKSAISLLIASMNATQRPDYLPINGVQVPKCNEEAFFMGATPTA